MDKPEAFTCLLYAPKASAVNINDLRYHMFCAKKGEIESHQLPPSKGLFGETCTMCKLSGCNMEKVFGAGPKDTKPCWQRLEVGKRCLEQDPRTPSPVGRGWRLESEEGTEQLVVHWTEGQPAPEAVVNLLACSCPRRCELPKCVCLSNGLRCTDQCIVYITTATCLYVLCTCTVSLHLCYCMSCVRALCHNSVVTVCPVYVHCVITVLLLYVLCTCTVS